MSDEAKSQQWHLLIKPLYRLVSLLNRQSDDFAAHCITGCIGSLESAETDPENPIPQQRRVIGKVITKYYMTEGTGNDKALYAGVQILLSLLDTRTKKKSKKGKSKQKHKKKCMIGP